MKFTVSLICAVIIGAISGVILGLADIEMGILPYIIIGIASFAAFSIGGAAYEKIKKVK